MQIQQSGKVFTPTAATWCGKHLEAIASQRLAGQQHIRQWVGVDGDKVINARETLTHSQVAKRRLQALEAFFDELKTG